MSAMNQKPNEAGWFYHAPAKRDEHREPVGAPPASQIPGLGEIEILEREEPREMVFRDTDTKYIRMAKMGGRKDLLTIRPNPGTKKEAVNYPRNDWYYLEDNALQDQAIEEQEQYQFMLPEYMVHQPHGLTTVDTEQTGCPTEGVPMRRAPYATEDQSQFQRDGHLMTDKTFKLAESRPSGYGVRTRKPPPKGPKVEKNKPLSSQMQGERPRLKFQPLPAEPEAPTDMLKLLANTYEREWHDRVNQWQDKQSQNREKSQAFVQSDPPVGTEYNNNYTKASAGSQKSNRITSSSSRSKNPPRQKEEAQKEPFKMSKFKNVPSRISSYQSPEVLAAVSN